MKDLLIAALISGGGSNLQAVIDACENGAIPGRVVCVGSDVPDVFGLERATKHNIPSFVVDYKRIIRSFAKRAEMFQQGVGEAEILNQFDEILREPDGLNGLVKDVLTKQKLIEIGSGKDQKEFAWVWDFFAKRVIAEAQILEALADYEFDLLILAGFMRNFSPYIIDRINIDPTKPRIMNIHPAILPAHPGVDGYGDTHRDGNKIGGCTVHFIDYGEDSGPIIGQRAFPIPSQMTLDDIKAAGLKLEWELYPECIAKFAESKLHVMDVEHRLDNGQTVIKRRVYVQ